MKLLYLVLLKAQNSKIHHFHMETHFKPVTHKKKELPYAVICVRHFKYNSGYAFCDLFFS